MRIILVLPLITTMFWGGVLSAGDEIQSPQSTSSGAFPVTISVDAAKAKGELRPIWRFFGCDEPNYAYMKDGKKLLAELGQLDQDPEILPSPSGRGAGGEGGTISNSISPHPIPLPAPTFGRCRERGFFSARTTC